ncbi:hypothetical protein OCK02_22130 [Rhizobium sp. TRM96647]|nr:MULTISPECIES: hypothetical protein [unclassified Rhizobium]MCV3738886.1 hypothetical protein [Rhizobium sp. TRM96647]MCV3760715.1 hypothetical protein [Rhizobium sp. TRM96650]
MTLFIVDALGRFQSLLLIEASKSDRRRPLFEIRLPEDGRAASHAEMKCNPLALSPTLTNVPDGPFSSVEVEVLFATEN